MIETQCPHCSNTIRVADGAAGKTGKCPKCKQQVTIPGLEQKAESEDGRLSLKDAIEEPSFGLEGSEFRKAQRHTYIPGIVMLLAYGAIGAGFRYYKPTAMAILDRPEDWSVFTLLGWFMFMFFVTTAFGVGVSAAAWTGKTGKVYSEDRAEFARAGGYDIGRWVPILAALLLWVVYWQTLTPDGSDPIALIRGPWIFAMLSGLFGFVATVFVAIIVFNARYGNTSKPDGN